MATSLIVIEIVARALMMMQGGRRRRRRRILQVSASQHSRSLVPIMAIMFKSS